MTTQAARARDAAVHCEAKLHGFRKTQDGVSVTFNLHPAEVPSTLALAPLGTRYMLALVELGDDEEPVTRPAASSNGRTPPFDGEDAGSTPVAATKEKRKRNEIPYAQRAGMIINNPLFWRYMQERGWRGVIDANEADRRLKEICEVERKRDIGSKVETVERFLELESSFNTYVARGEYARENA